MIFLVELLDKFFRMLSIAGIAAVLLAIVGHRVIFGVHYPGLGRDKKDVKRFSLWERFIHLITLLSFAALGITGFVSVIGLSSRLSGWLLFVHLTAAPVFALGMIAIALRWAEDCRFEICDWEWAKKFGGYLGYKGEVPAGRFNGGQKGFFWAILCLVILCMLSGALRMFPVVLSRYEGIVYQVHRYSSLLLVIFIIVHIYLGTAANPGTWQVLLSGYVSSRWAKLHHSLWQHRVEEGAKSGEENRTS